jgi:hypothetical protein
MELRPADDGPFFPDGQFFPTVPHQQSLPIPVATPLQDAAWLGTLLADVAVSSWADRLAADVKRRLGGVSVLAAAGYGLAALSGMILLSTKFYAFVTFFAGLAFAGLFVSEQQQAPSPSGRPCVDRGCRSSPRRSRSP